MASLELSSRGVLIEGVIVRPLCRAAAAVLNGLVSGLSDPWHGSGSGVRVLAHDRTELYSVRLGGEVYSLSIYEDDVLIEEVLFRQFDDGEWIPLRRIESGTEIVAITLSSDESILEASAEACEGLVVVANNWLRKIRRLYCAKEQENEYLRAV